MRWAVYKGGYKACKVRGARNDVLGRLVGDPLDLQSVLSKTRPAKQGRVRAAPWGKEPHLWRITDGLRLETPGVGFRHHEVEEEGSLFLTFARTLPDLPGVLTFANEYGLLGYRAPEDDTIKGPTRGSHWHAERLSDWVSQIRRMRTSIEVWRLAKSETVQALDRLARLICFDRAAGTVFFRGDPEIRQEMLPECPHFTSVEVVARRETDEEFVRSFVAHPDYVYAGFKYVVKMINKGLRTLTVIGDGEDGSRTDHRLVFPQLSWDPGNRRVNFEHVPVNLISALWFQFARAVVGAKSYETCPAPGCGKWFETGTRPGGRSTKKFCSDTCRARASRVRRSVESTRKTKS